jgi:hypothetical protein
LDELLKRLVRFGKAVRKNATDFCTSMITLRSVRAIDRYVVRHAKTEVWFKLGEYRDSVLSQFMWWVDDRTSKALKSIERDPFFDIGCELSIHPVTDNKGKAAILLLLYCEHRTYEKLFKRIVKARPYEYFDNTDRPEEVSEKEWQVRRRLWEKALPGVCAPVERGYGFNCITNLSVNYFLIGVDAFIKHIPSDDDRIEHTTWDWAMDLALKRKGKALKKQHKIKEWLRTSKAGQRLVENCRAKVKKRLPKMTIKTLHMDSKKVLIERDVKTK